MDEQEIVDQFVEVVTNNVGAISSTRLNSQVLLTFLFAYGISLSKIEFKDYSSAWSNKDQINVQLHYDRLPEGLNRILYGGDIVKCQDGKYHMIADISFSRYRDNAELIMRHDLNAKNSLKEYQEAFDVIIDSNEQAVENLKNTKKRSKSSTSTILKNSMRPSRFSRTLKRPSNHVQLSSDCHF